MYDKTAIRAIKERLNIVDIVRQYVDLKRNGANWSAPCPFHQETKPSFSVNEERGMFHCFGCQASGDIFEFYGRINGLDFRDCLEQLADRAGVRLERISPQTRRQSGEHHSKKIQMLRMNAFAAAHFAEALQRSGAAECQAYIERRGLSPEIVERFGLGWAEREWHALSSAFGRAGFDAPLAAEAGLLGQSGTGRYYDRFRGRLIFPIKDLSNQIIAFGGRIIADEDEAKYINSADSPIYKKGEHLYGLAQARRGITAKGKALLTEGYMDVLTLHQFGYDNAVGVLGTALTEAQIRRLSGFTSSIALLFDGDRAGRKAALRSCEMLLTRGLACAVVIMPDGEDIDSLLRTAGPEAFENLLDNAPDGISFCVDEIKNLAPREVVDWARNFLRHVAIPELLSPYISRLASRLRLSEEELRQGLAAWRRQQKKAAGLAGRTGTSPEIRPGKTHDRQILMFAVRYPDRLEDLRSIGADLALHSSAARRFWKKLEASGEEAFHMLEGREKQFWMQCRGEGAPPREGHGDRELAALEQHLAAHRKAHGKAAIAAALAGMKNARDFERQLVYLGALQTTLEQKK